MNFQAARKSSWPAQGSIVLTRATNLHMLIRELVRSLGWTVTEATDSIQSALHSVRKGATTLLIVDDTPDFPAIETMRHLMRDPVGAITPTLVFAQDQTKAETPALQRLGRPSVVEKPLTPSKFQPAFQSLVRRWDEGPWLSLRQAKYEIINGNLNSGLKQIARLSEQEAVHTLCATTLSIQLRTMGKIKEAETLLLNCLKRSPRDLGALMALGDLYIHTAMPKLAHRVFAGARNAYPGSMIPVADLMQAALMMGQIQDAIGYLYTMFKAAHQMDKVPQYLARLLYSEGREGEAEKVVNHNRAAFSRIQAAWNSAESANNLAAAG